MELLWVPISMLAALMQSVRTAAQKSLNARLSTWMTTYVRSLFGLPFMLVYLWAMVRIEGVGAPQIDAQYLGHCAGAAVAQVMGTFLLIQLFRMSNFAVGTMLSKTDVMQTAIIGSLLFSEAISAIGWVAIVLTVLGVILISAGRARAALPGSDAVPRALVSPATLVGLATGFSFSLSYLFLREASLVLDEGSLPWRAAWTMVVVTSMQVIGLGLWLLLTEAREFARLPALARPCLFIGVTSAIGSVGWFTAMALQNASYVKAVGQVEVVFTVLISTLYFRERIAWIEYAGIATIVLGVLLFVL
jgi:drug/metabolite transporter (DMT)-like permease